MHAFTYLAILYQTPAGIELLGLGESIMIQMKLLSLLEEESSEALLYAALLGNTSVITDYLQKYPNEVLMNLVTDMLIIITYSGD